MARATWHPYAPDQEFGHQAAQDEELLDRALARLEQGRQRAPRAGGKAEPSGERAVARRDASSGLGRGGRRPACDHQHRPRRRRPGAVGGRLRE